MQSCSARNAKRANLPTGKRRERPSDRLLNYSPVFRAIPPWRSVYRPASTRPVSFQLRSHFSF